MSTTPTPSDPEADDLGRGVWRLDRARSRVEFRVPHFWGLVTVKGHFDRYSGTLDLAADPAVQLTIDADSLQTGNPRRDRHLGSGDFFDIAHHPRVRFISDSAVLEGGTLKVSGRLYARGREVPVELDARIRGIDGQYELDAATRVNHRELGMTWSPLGMVRPTSELIVKGLLSRDPAGGRTP